MRSKQREAADYSDVGKRRFWPRQAAKVVLCLAAFGWASDGFARSGKCFLSVDGRTYLDSICNIETSADGGFSIGTGERTRSKYFAAVDVEPATGRATGYWNGRAAEGHAHETLGVLTRQGDCWRNERATVCATPK
jgi:hypothetical protein